MYNKTKQTNRQQIRITCIKTDFIFVSMQLSFKFQDYLTRAYEQRLVLVFQHSFRSLEATSIHIHKHNKHEPQLTDGATKKKISCSFLAITPCGMTVYNKTLNVMPT